MRAEIRRVETSAEEDLMRRLPPGGVLAILLAQVALLVVLLVSWLTGPHFRQVFPHGLLFAFLPAIVPWAGALGGATNAIRAVDRYWSARSLPPGSSVDWSSPHPTRLDPRAGAVITQRLRWNAWAVMQPLLGAIYGSFAVLLVALIIGAVGSSADGLDTSPRGKAVLAVVAFLVGYKQKVFHDLLDRSLSVLLGPGDTADDQADAGSPKGLAATPTSLPLTTSTGSSAHGQVTLTNGTGAFVAKDAVQVMIHPTEGDASAFSVSPLTRNIGRQGTATLDVTFRPTKPGAYRAELQVEHSGDVSTVTLLGHSPDGGGTPAEAGPGAGRTVGGEGDTPTNGSQPASPVDTAVTAGALQDAHDGSAPSGNGVAATPTGAGQGSADEGPAVEHAVR